MLMVIFLRYTMWLSLILAIEVTLKRKLFIHLTTLDLLPRKVKLCSRLLTLEEIKEH